MTEKTIDKNVPGKLLRAFLIAALTLLFIPVKVLSQPDKAYAADQTIQFSNGDTATLHEDGSITGYATLQGNYWSASERLGKFGSAIMPGGTVLPTACYEVYLGNPDHLSYGVPSNGTYGFTATPAGSGYFVVIDSSGASPVPGTPYVPYTQRTYTTRTWEAVGSIQLHKASANPSITNGNACYNMDGIQYGVYRDESCTDQAAVLTCDANGDTEKVFLAPGNYWVKEIGSSTEGTGYAIDETAHSVTIPSGDTLTLNVTDLPQNDPGEMIARKLDVETGKAYAQGNAKLEGAEFTVRYYDGFYDTVESAEAAGAPTRTWTFRTNASGTAWIDDASFVSGDSMYRDVYGTPTIPLGTILIQETKAPTGYLLGEQTVSLQQIKPNTSIDVTVAFNEKVEKEQVKRGDLEFVKVGENDMNRLSGVPFKLTSETTGESHILVTDDNGYVSTNASWNPHTQNTNGNDSADEGTYDDECGIWFGQDALGNKASISDGVGALPYDTYTLEELPCSKNEPYALLKIPGITIKRDATTINLGTLDDPIKQNVILMTTAYDAADMDKYVMADAAAAVHDTVQYMNLTAGEEYTLRGTLVLAETGDVLVDTDGNPFTGETTFTAEAANGKTSVTIPFDSRAFQGKDVVVYEKLFHEGMEIAAHEDKADVDQQVRILEPRISTTATDGTDGDKLIEASQASIITDQVRYENLVAGNTYTLQGFLMVRDAEGNVTVLDDGDGNRAEQTVEFTASSASGTVDVTFVIDATALEDGCTIVAYERLYSGDHILASHEDPDDQGQTVTVIHPSITTTATDGEDGDKTVTADAIAVINDAVAFDGLRQGEEYELYGVVMDKKTGLPLDTFAAPESEEDTAGIGVPDEAQARSAELERLWKSISACFADADGKIGMGNVIDTNAYDMAIAASAPIADDLLLARVAFTPSASAGVAHVDFAFDASKWILAEEAVDAVAYEVLAKDGRVVAVHADIEDEGQTVRIAPSGIGTEATDAADADHSVLPSLDATIIDTVYYENLLPGREYIVTGKLMDKATGKQLYINDKPVEQTVAFTPNAPSGQVEVQFTLDTTQLLDKEIVAFEEVSKDGIVVAVHADIEDAAQTVVIQEGPLGSILPKTGGWTVWAALAAIGAACVALGCAKQRIRKAAGESAGSDTPSE